jgi:hypothetical protein
MPPGVPEIHVQSEYRKYIQTPGLLLILTEFDANYRQIFTDGRPLPVNPKPSYHGYSSGHWEGDTLVVQSNGFRDGTWIDLTGNVMTDAAKVTERFHRLNLRKYGDRGHRG